MKPIIEKQNKTKSRMDKKIVNLWAPRMKNET